MEVYLISGDWGDWKVKYKVICFWKVIFRKVNYFVMFGSVKKNKLENIF
jgi:hypothetical protein